jgi:hypothetical protein
MQYGQDQYEKVSLFSINNIMSAAPIAVGYPSYSASTINSKSECKALLATNTDVTGVSFNAFSYGEQLAGITNYFLFSENIQSGITNGSLKWSLYNSAAHPSIGSRYSSIIMPDGSTNGVIVQTYAVANTSGANNGIYFGFPSSTFMVRGNVYTASVWVACDDSGGFPSTTTMRISFYGDAAGFPTSFSEDFVVTTTPRRVSFTFVANNNTASAYENIAFANGSGVPAAAKLVFWGAQLVDGNTAGPYIPTSTQWNGLATGIGESSVEYRNVSGVYAINRTSIHVPANTSLLLNSSAFAVSTNNPQNVAPPSTLQMYGLY